MFEMSMNWCESFPHCCLLIMIGLSEIFPNSGRTESLVTMANHYVMQLEVGTCRAMQPEACLTNI